MSEVGIRALKQNASEVIRRAAAGEIITVTDRGKPVAQITPLKRSRLDELRDAGLITPATRSIHDLPEPVPLPDGAPSLSEVLREMRDDERY